MSRRPLQVDPFLPAVASENSLVSKAAANEISGLSVTALKKVYILKIDSLGVAYPIHPFDTKTSKTLLLNPTTWDDNKNSNWIPHNVPGQSDPVYQWVSGGPRIVSFEALVTRDHSNSDEAQAQQSGIEGNIANRAVVALSSAASQLAGVNLPLASLSAFATRKAAQVVRKADLNISGELQWYRSLLYPTYHNNNLDSSPPLVAIMAGDTLGGSSPGAVQPSMLYNLPNGEQGFPAWVLINLSISVTKQTPSLHPMEAVVQFQFAEYRLLPKSGSSIS